MATTEERRALREHLQSLGFERVSTTRDWGNGSYAETFANGMNQVVITWAPKDDEVREFFSKDVAHGRCRLCGNRHGRKHAPYCRHAGKFVGDIVNPEG